MTTTDTTLRRDLQTTNLRPPLKAIRCASINPKTQRLCNKMLFRLNGTAQVTCPRCGSTAYYTSDRP